MERIITARPDVRSTASAARSVRDLNEDFVHSRGEVGQLERLRDELEAQKGNKDIGVLRLKVINALLAARKSAADAVSAPKQLTLRSRMVPAVLRRRRLFLGWDRYWHRCDAFAPGAQPSCRARSRLVGPPSAPLCGSTPTVPVELRSRRRLPDPVAGVAGAWLAPHASAPSRQSGYDHAGAKSGGSP
jgi:hypothetical protein